MSGRGSLMARILLGGLQNRVKQIPRCVNACARDNHAIAILNFYNIQSQNAKDRQSIQRGNRTSYRLVNKKLPQVPVSKYLQDHTLAINIYSQTATFTIALPDNQQRPDLETLRTRSKGRYQFMHIAARSPSKTTA